jgi:hypothetical protein
MNPISPPQSQDFLPKDSSEEKDFVPDLSKLFQKTVHFHPKKTTYTIPTRAWLEKENLIPVLWSSVEEEERFQLFSELEVTVFSKEHNIGYLDAHKALYRQVIPPADNQYTS